MTSRTFKSIVFRKEKLSIFKISLFDLHIDFGSMLVPTCLHVSTKNPPKSHKKSIPKGNENLIDFRHPFSLILAPSWDPSWAHVGHFFATRRPQDHPKRHQKLVPTLKTAQNASWTRSGTLQTSMLAPPDLHFCSPRPRSWCP